MERHFHERLRELKGKMITMSRLAQYMIESAMEGLVKGNPEFAEQVFEKEKLVNLLEIEIDNQGHTLLALAQPMAVDLRSITTILKINTDLERIADHAVNIAEKVREMMGEAYSDLEIKLPEMAAHVREVLNDAVDSFIREDVQLAQQVLKKDDKIDDYNDTFYSQLEDYIQTNPFRARRGMSLARISHELERIGDLANNIAEDVIYATQGKEVRHHADR